MTYKSLKKLIFLLPFCLIIFDATAQKVDYSVQANIVYRFTKYIDWPSRQKNGDFIIGVFGDSPIYQELSALTRNKHVGNQLIIIMRLSSESTFQNCHILFISEEESGRLKKIAVATANKPVLIISENTGLIWKGACINFIIANDRLKLEFNKSAIEKRDLHIASELLDLGTVVN